MPPSEQNKDAAEYERVFRHYVEVCNRAIEANKDKFPYTEIWGARLKSLQDEVKIHAVVFDDRPKLAYMLRLTKEMKIEIAEKKELPPEDAWPFTYQYLKRVVEHPQEYIANPARLQWGWLQNVFGPVSTE